MARPFKSGVDYFPLDVNMDDKIKLIQAQHKLIGFAIVVKLYQKIYASNYWVKWDKKAVLVFCDENNVDINEVDAIINSCVEWELFDKKLFEKYGILTSKGIQKRYFEIIKRRKKVGITNEFLLVDYKEYLDLKKVNVYIISVNADISTQSKVKESKGDNKKLFVEDSNEFRLAKYLESWIVKNNEKFKKKDIQKWALQFDYILRIDGRNVDEVKELIKWCQTDSFWMTNILSPSKFRDQYDQLRLKKNKSGQTNQPESSSQNPMPKEFA